MGGRAPPFLLVVGNIYYFFCREISFIIPPEKNEERVAPLNPPRVNPFETPPLGKNSKSLGGRVDGEM